MVELWKPVEGWEGFYEVSDQARVKSLARRVPQGGYTVSIQDRILKQTKDGRGYLTVKLNRNGVGKTACIHRLIFLAFIDSKCTLEIDHIDGNRLNNQLNNLRAATRQQNGRNMAKRRNTSSAYKGVSFRKDTRVWAAYIKFQSKKVNLGCYPTQEQAAKAYNEAAIKYFGEFARLNEIKE